MKRAYLFLFLMYSGTAAKAETPKFGCEVSAGTAISLNQPAATPFTLHITGHYNVSPRFTAGAGTGISLYETPLVPVFGRIRFLLTRPRKFTPYIACNAGYAFAPSQDANGGLYIDPQLGVQYALPGKLRLSLSIGYEVQRLERLKVHKGAFFSTAYSEKLRHNSLSLKAGILF